MKHINIYLSKLFVVLLCTFSISGCKKFLDINQNPNAATEPPINGLLANTTYNTAYTVFDISNYTSYYTQYLSSPNTASDVDIYNQVNASGTWNLFYSNMTDLYDMRNFAAQKQLNAYIGVADILLALHLNMATNVWGDVPFFASLFGSGKFNAFLRWTTTAVRQLY